MTGLAGRTPRGRRGTTASGHSDRTTDSYSSRGDIFPSDDEEYGDAVPLDDEFAMALERRTTSDDMSSGKRPRMSRTSTHAKSSRSVKRQSRPASTKSSSSQPVSYSSEPPTKAEPTMLELDQEEQRLRAEEEQEIERKREAAQKLARERGLSVSHEPQTVRCINTCRVVVVLCAKFNRKQAQILPRLARTPLRRLTLFPSSHHLRLYHRPTRFWRAQTRQRRGPHMFLYRRRTMTVTMRTMLNVAESDPNHLDNTIFQARMFWPYCLRHKQANLRRDHSTTKEAAFDSPLGLESTAVPPCSADCAQISVADHDSTKSSPIYRRTSTWSGAHFGVIISSNDNIHVSEEEDIHRGKINQR